MQKAFSVGWLIRLTSQAQRGARGFQAFANGTMRRAKARNRRVCASWLSASTRCWLALRIMPWYCCAA